MPTVKWGEDDTKVAIEFDKWFESTDVVEFYDGFGHYLWEAEQYDQKHSKISDIS